MARKSKDAAKVLKKKAYDTPPESSKYFYLCDGRQIQNIAELLALLPEMEDSVFSCHVTDEKNDFANWIRDVFGEEEIAKKIEKKQTKDALRKSLYPFMST